MPHHGPSDAELLRRSNQGDAEAFERFMDRHSASVHRYLVHLTQGGGDDAEDLLQEAFLAAWRHAGDFRDEGSARGWLLTSARRLAWRRARKRSGEPDRVESLDELGLRAGWGGVEDPAGPEPGGLPPGWEARDTLERAMDRLSQEDREILLLRELEGFSGEETAELLDIGLPAMKSRLHRARLRLATAVREGVHD